MCAMRLIGRIVLPSIATSLDLPDALAAQPENTPDGGQGHALGSHDEDLCTDEVRALYNAQPAAPLAHGSDFLSASGT